MQAVGNDFEHLTHADLHRFKGVLKRKQLVTLEDYLNGEDVPRQYHGTTLRKAKKVVKHVLIHMWTPGTTP